MVNEFGIIPEPEPRVSQEKKKKGRPRTMAKELALRFLDRDMDLYHELVASAEANRRFISAGIFCRLERLRDLEKEKGNG